MNWTVTLIFLGVALLMVLASYLRGDLTKRQMRINCLYSSQSCLSHTGIWGDVLLIPWLAGIIASYHHGWYTFDYLCLGGIAFVVTLILHALWARNNPPDHNISKRRTLTAAGWLHLLFMSAMLTLVALFYFATAKVALSHLVWVSVLLGIHTTLSTAVLERRRLGYFTPLGVIIATGVWIILIAKVCDSI